MEVEKMVDLIQERHGVALDPTDPMFLLGTLAAELAKESRAEFGRIAMELTDQVAATLALADTAAKARSERLITEAAKWSSEQIRRAGIEVAEAIGSMRNRQPQTVRHVGPGVFALVVAGAVVFGVGAGWWIHAPPCELACADQADGSRVCWMYTRLPTAHKRG